MGRPSSSRALTVWMNGERTGSWRVRPRHADEFSYSPEWLSSKSRRPISLSMPLQTAAYSGEKVSAYFDNLLPDSKQIRSRIQRRYGTRSTAAFDLLQEVGRDCVGAIQLLPEGSTPSGIRRIESKRLTGRQIESILVSMINPSLGTAFDEGDFRISLAGAQEKTALLRLEGKWMLPLGDTPTTHILKLPIGTGGGGIDLTTSVENEWLCSQLLRGLGLPVADCWIDQFGEKKVLVVERFDRRMSRDRTWLIRLPQEDFCQIQGLASDRKYESEGGPGIRKIMDLLLGSSQSGEDRRSFYKTQMLFWMLCAIDGNAKNFSIFLEAGGTYRLTPTYDVLSAYPVLGASKGKLSPRKVKMAMAVQGANRHYRRHDIQPRHWQEMAASCGIRSMYPSILEEIIESTPRTLDDVSNRLPPDFPENVSTPILQGMRQALIKLKMKGLAG